MYNSTSPISSFTPSSPTLPSSSSSSNNNNDNFENNDIITSSSISIQNQRLSPIPLQRSSSLQSQPSLLIERPNTPTYTRKSTRHLSQQEPDTTAIWGWILLILTFVIFVFSMYAIVFSKLIPETGNKSSCIKKRITPTSPEYAPDVPGLIDDYYLNLLDWVSAITIIGSGTNTISSLSWSEDGDHLAVGLNDGNIEICNIWSVQKIRSVSGHTTCVGVMTWNKHIIVSGCRDGSIWKHDIRLAQHKFAEMHNHNREVCGLKWRSDGEQLTSEVMTVELIFGMQNQAFQSLLKLTIKLLPWQRNLLATGGGIADQQIYFWNTDTSLQLKSINTQSQVTSIVWSNHYNEVLSTHGDPNFQFTIWKYPSLKKIIDVKDVHLDCILHSALSPGGEIVATLM
ncbi:14691_t:CDS:2 [Entrophospora sp. SA101]|nr:14691_t:CDS:2 [Entrophospora sp. SA101]